MLTTKDVPLSTNGAAESLLILGDVLNENFYFAKQDTLQLDCVLFLTLLSFDSSPSASVSRINLLVMAMGRVEGGLRLCC